MTDYSPPTEDLPIFDSIVFLSGDEPLTYNQAKKKFLRYPNAQGTENLQAINVGGIATFNNVVNMNKSLTMSNTNSSNRQIYNTYYNMLDATTNANDGTIYANNGVFYYDNNINNGTHEFDVNDGSGNQKIPLQFNSSTATLNLTTGTTIENPYNSSSSNYTLQVRDTTSGDKIGLIPYSNNGWYNPMSQLGDKLIIGDGSVNAENMTIGTRSSTSCGIRLSATQTIMGTGGTTTTPSNNILTNNTNVIMTTVSGTRCNMAYNGGQKNYGLEVIDTVSSDKLGFYAYANENWDNTIINLGDKAIVGNGTTNSESLALTVNSTTTSGMRISANNVYLGAGGTSNNPSNQIDINGSTNTTTTTGTNLTISNTNVSFSSTNPPTSSQTNPASNDSSNKIPTTAWVQSAISAAPLPSNATFNQMTISPTSTSTAPLSGIYNFHNEGGYRGFYNSSVPVQVTIDGINYYVSSTPVNFYFTSGDASSPNLNNPIQIECDLFFWEPITQQMGRNYFKCIIFPSFTSPSTPPSTGWGFQSPTPGNYNGSYDVYNTINGNTSFFYTNATYAPNGRQYWFYDASYHDFGNGKKAGWVGAYPNGSSQSYNFTVTFTAFNGNTHYYLYNTKINGYYRGSGTYNTDVKLFPA